MLRKVMYNTRIRNSYRISVADRTAKITGIFSSLMFGIAGLVALEKGGITQSIIAGEAAAGILFGTYVLSRYVLPWIDKFYSIKRMHPEDFKDA